MRLKLVEEVSEELFFALWPAWQLARLILFFRRQREATQSAKTLVDFTNVMESEMDAGGNEEIIVFDMKQIEQQQKQHYSKVSGSTKRLGVSAGDESARDIEMQDVSGNRDDDVGEPPASVSNNVDDSVEKLDEDK